MELSHNCLIHIRCGVVANISRFHRGAPGSIPGRGVFIFLLFCPLDRCPSNYAQGLLGTAKVEVITTGFDFFVLFLFGRMPLNNPY